MQRWSIACENYVGHARRTGVYNGTHPAGERPAMFVVGDHRMNSVDWRTVRRSLAVSGLIILACSSVQAADLN
jgi:hypothetical protein